jgi:hypothetical protein
MAQVPILPADFVDLLTEFADAEVQYLVIGGYAVGFHDRPRATKDLDFSAAYKRHSTMKAGALTVAVAGLDDLIAMKIADCPR